MNNLSNYTTTELLKMINDINELHDKIRNEIIEYTYQVEKFEKIINEKIDMLNNLEKNYLILIEELNNRNAI